ncbi:metallophosphoesterase [Rubripirellula reticaptiva]|uniref:Calcineurin-like phosphoesterase superfamily domain protein n=1 Tax=Rubripirellula reticaptiva TaxID=2528013 RepID=A0A5C6EEJ1_9BACT|nr:metallophosphoesterase [Rubripirellula reticaptiva]TWU47080.1 Calcineurin-like phosphoesterase superfamily domain protein [Rubripirellula reticaptiva]
MIDRWEPSVPLSREQSALTVAFVSDLHWLSARSNYESHETSIRNAVSRCNVCVWGGDLFDFRWSQHANDTFAIEASLEWLDHWYRDFPETRFVFLNGNHDAHESFQVSLVDWAASRDRFEVGAECLRIGDTIWLHGDVIEGDGSADAFSHYRNQWKNKPTSGRLASLAYDVAVNARIHKAAALAAHRRKNTCMRLLRWLQRQPANQTSGVRRIVFGHTHRRINGFRIGSHEFFNGGAAIRHVPFQPIVLTVQQS